MRVFPIINQETKEFDLQQIDTNNKSVGVVDLFGWETEDGFVVYSEEVPKFHPLTGEVLDYIVPEGSK